MQDPKMHDYDPNNIFAKILRKELPAHVVYEDDHTLVIMDIMPRAPGHCLVLPKTAARNILDVSEESLTAVIKTVRKISTAAKTAFQAKGITIYQFNEAAGGQSVFHLHFHIIPSHGQVLPSELEATKANQSDLEESAAKLRAALGN